MEDTEGVAAECSMGLAMLQRGLAFLCPVAFGLFLWHGGFSAVGVEVPRWRREVPKRDRGVGEVVVVGLGVRRGQFGQGLGDIALACTVVLLSSSGCVT